MSKLARVMKPTQPWGRTPNARHNLIGMPLPRTDAELEVLTTIFFGTPLHLAKFRAWVSSGESLGKAHDGCGDYEVREFYDSYHGDGWVDTCGRYDEDRRFWARVLGSLYCGGVAGHSYGQFYICGSRNLRRLVGWVSSRRKKSLDRVREPFVRLAERYGLREKTEIRGIRLLMHGREDGACAATTARSEG